MHAISHWFRRVSPALPPVVILAGLLLPGCGGGTGTPAGGGSGTPAAAPEVSSSPTSEAQGEDAEIAAALAKLSPEDQTAAKAQKVCPVGGGPLGAMGTPVIVMAGERKVFLCCDGCEQEFKDNMDKYLAKLSGGDAEAAPEGAPAVVPDSQPEGGAASPGGESGT